MRRLFIPAFVLVSFFAPSLSDPIKAQTIGNSSSNLRGQIGPIGQPGRNNTITTAVPFLLIGPDARGAGMGNAGVSTKPDRNAPHWNSSKLAFIEDKVGAGVSYVPWLRELVNDIDLGYASGYFKLTPRSTLGASAKYFYLGEFQITGRRGNVIRTYNPKEYMFELSYSRKFGEKFAAGISAKYIHSDLFGGTSISGSKTSPGQAPAMGLSFFYRNEELELGKGGGFNFGLDISNIGPKISYTSTSEAEFLPINLRLGPTLDLGLDEYNRLSFTAEFNKLLVPSPPIYGAAGTRIIAGRDPDRSVPAGIFGSFTDAPGHPVRDENGDIVMRNDGSGRARIQEGSRFREEMQEIDISSGIEYAFAGQFFARAGYFYEHPNKGGRQYVTLGSGARYKWISLDISYLLPLDEDSPLAKTIRFSIGLDF